MVLAREHHICKSNTNLKEFHQACYVAGLHASTPVLYPLFNGETIVLEGC